LLSVYQNGQRTGFCEFATSVEQEMAELDENSPPPEGFMARAGYKIRLNGNIGFGDFTNRVKFDGRVSFSSVREWRELNLKLSAHGLNVEIHSFATNENFHVKFYGEGVNGEVTLRFSDLQNPGALLNSVGKNLGFGLPSDFELPLIHQDSSMLAHGIQWQAHRERVLMGREPVTVYRLETRVLENPIIIHISTLGEILRIDLPAGLSAKLDEWSKQ
jgi:hypothetical protein